MPDRPAPPGRAEFPVFRSITTRWADNDVYGHVNNVVYYAWFDSAVNGHLIEAGALDIRDGATIGLVVESGCSYFRPLAFPQAVEIGLAVARLGTSSVAYRLGVFAAGADEAAALGRFVHVYVDRATRRPAALPEALRAALAPLAV